MIPWLAALALAAVETPTKAPPVVAMTGDQALAVMNADWSSRGERPFARVPGREAAGVSACADGDLCVLLAGSGGQVRAITLSAPAKTRESAAHYLSAVVAGAHDGAGCTGPPGRYGGPDRGQRN